MEFKKIAVLRANALGDFVFTLPALYALRERFPDAEIVLLAQSSFKDFLAQRKLPFNRVVTVPPYPGVGEAEDYQPDPAEVNRFFSNMQDEAFDLAIQIHGGGRNSNPFLKKLGATFTLGLKTPDAEPLDISVPYVYYQNEILRLLEVVNEVGAQTKNIEPKLQVVADDLREAEQAIGLLDEKERIVILHPGATDLRRHWPTAKFAEAGDHFSSKGFMVCVTGTLNEKPLIDKVVNSMTQKSINLCGKLTISGLVGLLSKASLVISNDTGPLHLARSLDIPTVGIYWCGNLINAGPITRKFIRPQISWQTHCPICGEDCATDYAFDKRKQSNCNHDTSFVSCVEVESVTRAGEEMLMLHNGVS